MAKSSDYLVELQKQSNKIRVELGHPHIGTEHFLAALLAEEESTVTRYLKDYTITLDTYKKKVEEVAGRGKLSSSSSSEVLLTPLAKSLCNNVSKFCTSNNISPSDEVVMLHILWNSEGLAMRVLELLGFGDTDQDDFEEFLHDRVCIFETSSTTSSISDLLGDSTKNDAFRCLTDMHKYVKENNITVTGFDDELEQLVKGLLRYKKPNVILLGEPGVGKTALVEKLAIAINEHKVPPIISKYRIMQLSINTAIAGTRYRGDFEEKIEKVLSAVAKQKNIVLFIDEIHNIVGAGATGNADATLDAANILKPYLARGAIKVIGATTNEEYEYIKRDGALARRFKTLEILEPTKEQTMDILKSMKPVMLEHYDVKISNKELEDIYYQSTFRKGRMPDVALDELEEFCVDVYYKRCKEEVDA